MAGYMVVGHFLHGYKLLDMYLLLYVPFNGILLVLCLNVNFTL